MSRSTRFVLLILAIVFVSIVSYFHSHADNPNFGSRVDLGLIEYPAIREASGMAASRKNPGVLWTHNDSDNENRLFAFNLRGRHLGQYYIGSVPNRDWEDMAVGPGPIEGEQYLYVGDIGDNSAEHYIKYIYRILEPSVDSSQSPVDSILTDFDVIAYRYPDGERDAETLLVDPKTKDIYIVSKREDSVRVYRAAFPQDTEGVLMLEYVTSINIKHITGGDISSNGSEILLKTYTTVYYWYRSARQSIAETLNKDPLIVPYVPEPQGEAITWAPDGMGYYTISEEAKIIPARLYFYPRIVPIQTNNE
jgi:hypothetical protein